jgi:flagellar M-ring protein FliF
MDVLNKALAQLGELFRSMSPGARMTAGLLLAVVVVSLAYLFNHQISAGDNYLLGGQAFSAHELPAMEAAFGKANLSGYSIDGNRVRIPAGQQAAYMGALADNGALPAHFGDFLTEATMKVSPFTSRPQQEEMIKIAKQKELALVIRSMQGIENAAVHYDTQKKPGFQKGAVTTASVSVKPQGTRTLDESQVPMIRHLVAGAIAGLSPESVTVVDLNGRTYSAGNRGDGIGSALEDPYLARMKSYQTTYESQIMNALSYVPGITVTANVVLTKELRHREEKDTYDPKQTAIVNSREETTNSTSKSSSSGGGRPGLEAQGSSNQSARLTGGGGGGGPESTEERTSNEVQSVTSRDRQQTDFAGMTPERVTVSIGVPSTYFENIWRQRNPTTPGQPAPQMDKQALEQIQRDESDKIRASVSQIIPLPTPATDPASLVTVTTFSHVQPAELPAPPMTQQAFALVDSYGSTAGIGLLVVFSLLMLRSMLRQQPAPGGPEATPAESTIRLAQTEEPEPSASASKPKNRLKRHLGSGPSLRDELAEIVREDPDAAASILRGWIGNAS